MDKRKSREMIAIAVPAVIESIFTVIITSIDTKMISVLGKKAISAVALTTQPKQLFLSIFFALGTATSIFVSQAYGKKDKEEANRFLVTILQITIILSIILGMLLFIFAYPITWLYNRQEDTIDLSVSFFRIIMGGMIFQAVSIVIKAALRGIGKTKVTLTTNITMESLIYYSTIC